MPTEELKRKAYGFIFLKVNLGKENEVTSKLLTFSEVKEVHELTGEKDLLVVVELEHDILAVLSTTKRIADFVKDKISLINNVTDTDTIIPIRTIVKT